MIIIPSIDIKDGRVVRLLRGDYSQETVYPGTPVEYAKRWQDEGAELIHVVDLDGALTGKPINFGIVEKVVKSVDIPVELGGGLRKESDIATAFEIGVDRVVIGTKALDEDFISKLAQKYGASIIIGLDVRQGYVQTEGWRRETKVGIDKSLQTFEDLGLETVVFTDISKDGTLSGPNLEELKNLLKKTELNVILSGGISSLDDIKELTKIKSNNLFGAIIGRALYEERFKLKEAISIIEKGR